MSDNPNAVHTVSQSRRSLLKSAAALGAAGLAAQKSTAQPGRGRNNSILAYVGTYTNHGEGIYLVRVDLRTGELTKLKTFTGISNPSWLAIHPSKRFLYAVNEDFSPPDDTVSAFSLNPATGDLTFLNAVSAQGFGPAHCSVHPSGRYVFVANYGSGNVAVLPIVAGGGLGAAVDAKNDVDACTPACPVGPTNAQNAPPGSFAISGHDAPHAHIIDSDPTGNYVLVNDLGLDRTIIWKFNAVTGKLSDPKTVPSSPGAGPRHFAFHPNNRWFYSLNEEASTLAFMIWNASSGSLTPVSEIQTLPQNFVGTNFTSEIIISRDGRYAYAANRLHDTIAIFELDHRGVPTLIDEEWTRGDYPRNINIDPTGNYMYACNHRSDAVTTFRIDGDGRRLRFTGQYTAIGSPAIIVFLDD
jgi:6-phosphogluconolactonase (cycloisomerase 2 family)